MDVIFVMKIIEKYLGKGGKIYAAFMDQEKAYDKADKEALRNILKIYGVGRQLLTGTWAFYTEPNACVSGGRGQRKIFLQKQE